MAGKVINWNDYFINSDVTTLRITNKKGRIINVLIDTEDLEKIKEYNWSAGWRGGYQKRYYIQYSDYSTGKCKSILLHKFIMDVWDNREVDHIDHDSLNNRKYNLRPSEVKNNAKNRKGKNSNNKSGYRNVCWHKHDNCWAVQLQINGKNKVLKRFRPNQLEEAGKYAEEMRKKYYGEYAGEN